MLVASTSILCAVIHYSGIIALAAEFVDFSNIPMFSGVKDIVNALKNRESKYFAPTDASNKLLGTPGNQLEGVGKYAGENSPHVVKDFQEM